MLWARILADLIVVFHAAYVAFVVLGLARDPRRESCFAGAGCGTSGSGSIHLAMIAIVVGEALAGRSLPADRLGETAPNPGGPGQLPGRLPRLLGPPADLLPAEPWVFTLIYTLFGLAVLAAFVLAPPRLSRHRVSGDGTSPPIPVV